MKAIRGGECLSDAKKECVRKAYDALCKDGCLTLDTIAQAFDASKVPGGDRDERDTYMCYMGSFDTQERDGVVSWDEFLALHSDMSLGCPTDECFYNCLGSMFKITC